MGFACVYLFCCLVCVGLLLYFVLVTLLIAVDWFVCLLVVLITLFDYWSIGFNYFVYWIQWGLLVLMLNFCG